ncbi:MAG: hypothetical protein WCL21_02815 [Mariniphaga sp.]
MSELELIILNAREALELNKTEEALAILCQLSVANHAEVIFLKGEIYYKLQRWGDALNQFTLFLELFPSDKKAESYCLMIQNILGFFHKDFYNP